MAKCMHDLGMRMHRCNHACMHELAWQFIYILHACNFQGILAMHAQLFAYTRGHCSLWSCRNSRCTSSMRTTPSRSIHCASIYIQAYVHIITHMHAYSMSTICNAWYSHLRRRRRWCRGLGRITWTNSSLQLLDLVHFGLIATIARSRIECHAWMSSRGPESVDPMTLWSPSSASAGVGARRPMSLSTSYIFRSPWTCDI